MKKGEKMSKELKARISESRKGKCLGNKFAKGNKSNITSFKKGEKSWIVGKVHSEETRKKMSDVRKANPNRYWLGKKRPHMVGESNWNWKTIKHQCADCEKVIQSKSFRCRDCRHKYFVKDKTPNWRGGRTPLRKQIREIAEYRAWRKIIFERDGYICQICKKHGVQLQIDHFPKAFWEIISSNNIRNIEEAILCEEFWNINNGRTLCIDCHKKTSNYGKPLNVLRKQYEKI